MAKIIKLTPDVMTEILRDFEEALKTVKVSDGKINFSKSLTSIDRKADLIFTVPAWLKMQTLVREFDEEVAWHGIATRGDDPEKDEYLISDILVYPQEVTGTTVTTDQAAYQEWLMQHDDEVFNNIRMQGHSHVNMSTSPSSVDTSLYERILDQLESDMFYIFLIWNKRGEKTIKIYDLAKNILFETGDVNVHIQDSGLGLDAFLQDARNKVVDKVVPVRPFSGYGGYGGNPWPQQKPAAVVPKQEEPKKVAPSKHDGKKMKRKDKKDGYYTGLNKYSYCDDDDFDDPYGPFGYSDRFMY